MFVVECRLKTTRNFDSRFSSFRKYCLLGLPVYTGIDSKKADGTAFEITIPNIQKIKIK